MDITYVPMARGFVYLCAVVDWFSRRVLSWRLSITMEADFCIEAVEDALARYGKPEIFNTDQGSQFTLHRLHSRAEEGGDRHLDGKGAWRDNVFVERLWRSIKYEEVYLHTYRPYPRLALASAAISPSTIADVHIHPLTGRRRDQAYFNALAPMMVAA